MRAARWIAIALSLTAVLAVACDSDDDATAAGTELAERWLRAGEDNNAAIAVYEGALPPSFPALLNPGEPVDAPSEDLVALPVHPEGSLLGSYLLRRSDGSQVVWLFYDVTESTTSEVIDTVTGQMDVSPWQVLTQSGTRSNRLIAFESTRYEDVSGNAIAEDVPSASEFTVVVERDGEEVTLTIARNAPVPLLEASLDDGLVVQEVFAGSARVGGLREDDRVVRVGDVEVSTATELQAALEEMASGAGKVSLLYVLQFAPPLRAELPPFVPATGLGLPADFPARDIWAPFDLDQFEATRDPSGRSFFAAMFSRETPTAVANQVRDALVADGWEIVSDEAAGFGTRMQFTHEGDGLMGMVAIAESEIDDSLTQVFVQIQNAPD